MPSVLITGSNRGLGLEWTRQLVEDGWRVYATCRRPESAEELNRLQVNYADNLSVHRLDVTRPEEMSALVRDLGERPIDMLLNNAGTYFEKYRDEPLGSLNYENWEETFRVNTLGPVRMCEAFIEHLLAGEMRLVVAISSHMGSIADIGAGGDYAYRSSKSALNAAMKGLSHELQPHGITVVMLHPGWVRTRMGGPDAPYTPRESVQGMRRILERVRPEDSGRFFRFDGSILPW